MDDINRPAPNLTPSQARAAFVAIVTGLEQKLGYQPGELTGPGAPDGKVVIHQQGDGPAWPSTPVLCRNWEDRGGWAIVWEGGDYDWPHLGWPLAHEAGVHAEPYNGFALSLYPV